MGNNFNPGMEWQERKWAESLDGEHFRIREWAVKKVEGHKR